MYSYNVPVYNKNMQKIYRVMSVLWTAQKTESSLCFLKNIYKTLQGYVDASLTFKKVTTIVFF